MFADIASSFMIMESANAISSRTGTLHEVIQQGADAFIQNRQQRRQEKQQEMQQEKQQEMQQEMQQK